jgi:Ala-tRNA(Pro) deacylase
MSVNRRLSELLERRPVPYEVVPHPETVTTHEAAQSAHVAGSHVAKAVVVRDSAGADFMVVLPSTLHLDPWKVHHVTGRHGIHLEDEQELARIFPDCDVGAMPPIGHLYGLATYVDPCLIEDQEDIWFQAGNHHELVCMKVADFQRLAAPFYHHVCLHVEPALASS